MKLKIHSSKTIIVGAVTMTDLITNNFTKIKQLPLVQQIFSDGFTEEYSFKNNTFYLKTDFAPEKKILIYQIPSIILSLINQAE